MSGLCLSLLPCSMMFFVCLVCSTVCQSLASLNSINPFHLMKKIGLPIPSFLDNPFDVIKSMKREGFKNIDSRNKKKIKNIN